MAVNFQVVGIFYTTSVNFSALSGNTVGDVIQYLYNTDPGFFYNSTTNPNGDTYISSLTFIHDQPFTGRTGIAYPAGTYTLPDPAGSQNTPNSYGVWQYYLTNQNNVRQPVPGDQSYTVTTIQDGWSIVWRLVQICNGPVSTQKRDRKFIPKKGQVMQGIS